MNRTYPLTIRTDNTSPTSRDIAEHVAATVPLILDDGTRIVEVDADTYHGAPNRETWMVREWIRHDPETMDELAEQIHDLISLMPDVQNETIGGWLSDIVRAWWSMDQLDVAGALWIDLVDAALARVDWIWLASVFIEDWWSDRSEPNGI